MTTRDPARALADLEAQINDLAARRVTARREIANLHAEIEAIDARLIALLAEQRDAVLRSGL